MDTISTESPAQLKVIQHPDDRKNDGFHTFLESVQSNFKDLIETGEPLFTTAVSGEKLWQNFLGALTEDSRQHYNCHSCRRFVEAFGGLAIVDHDGHLVSPLWSVTQGVPGHFLKAVETLARMVQYSVVEGVFVTEVKTLGIPLTGQWQHLNVAVPSSHQNQDRLLSAFQVIAAKKESYGVLQRSLADFTEDVVVQALRLVESNSVYRTEVVAAPLKWFHALVVALKGKKAPYRNNLIWKAVALNTPAMTHIRSSMSGTLLEDISSGMAFEDVSMRFSEKMSPALYRRAQTEASDGNLDAAEKMIAQLGMGNSLKRAWLTDFSQVPVFWKPTVEVVEEKPSDGSVFGKLRKKEEVIDPLVLPTVKMSWAKFQAKVLPEALKIEYLTNQIAPFFGLTTAADMEAPPIVRWDKPDITGHRNPIAWFHHMRMEDQDPTKVKVFGNHPTDFNLAVFNFHEVSGLSWSPCHWYGNKDPMPQKVFFYLKGACDKTYDANPNLMLFMEILDPILNPIRKAVESLSKIQRLEGDIEEGIFGIAVQENSNWGITLRVTTKLGTQSYLIDRFE